MPLTVHRRKKFTIILLTCLILTGFVTGCSKPTPPTTNTPTNPGTGLLSLEPTAIPQINTFSPTHTATLLPQNDPDQSNSESGLIIFAMGDGKYSHLFAYHPSLLPITRLTTDPWNFDSPAVSPDGNKIAFCADQFGHWDVFILDLLTGLTDRLTQTGEYNCSPSWSPDGQWVAYENYQTGIFNIIIQSIDDPSTAPIKLTENSGNNHSPAWSPGGREIAFVTDRSGRSEIWIARLGTTDDRFLVLASASDADYSNPDWSPDGNSLAWTRTDQVARIEIWDQSEDFSAIRSVGLGSRPVWLPDNSGMLGSLVLPNEVDLVAYEKSSFRLLLPPIPMPGAISSYDWHSQNLANNIRNFLQINQPYTPDSLWQPVFNRTDGYNNRYGLAELVGIDAPQPYLSDAVDESFLQLRTATGEKIGWDFLAKLESAVLPITTAPQAGIPDNWLYTGRAIAVNEVPLDADWMVVGREDYNGLTYWRIWLKCLNQDGSCGKPLRTSVWDFDSRFQGDQIAYEEGGNNVAPPAGYWLDFTEFASRYGWERIPSYSNWRSYFPAIQFNVLVLRQSLSWQQSMLQIYPAEAVSALSEKNK